MPNLFFDLESWSTIPIKDGPHKYAEGAEIMLWSWALDDGQIYIWDLVNKSLHWQDELSGLWEERPTSGAIPPDLAMSLMNEDTLVVGHNSGQFDFVILEKCKPGIAKMIDLRRRRDTMVQAYSHSLPGSLDGLAHALNVAEDERKIKAGKRLIQLFCKPQGEDFVKKYGTNRASRQTHPSEWGEFIRYAGGDITTMRAAYRLMPKWNMKPREIDLWNLDLKINARGFHIDQDHARAAISVSDRRKAELAKRTQEITEGAVNSATQRDALMKFILEMHGVTLPDMLADTIERRLVDPDLPDAVKELMQIRLQASMNSVAKYKTVLRAVCSDGRIRGGAQFRGAARTGRWAHRLFQHGNTPRPELDHRFVELCIEMMKRDELELVYADVMKVCRSAVRGVITAAPGRKLVVADLANIEGRVAAWVAGEETLLQAFRDYDAGTGPDLYIKAYATSFNVDPETIDKSTTEGYDQRQIGKVQSLFFAYGGGVGAWVTGAATYSIDLSAMTEAVYPTLPEWAKSEATEYLKYLYEAPTKRYEKRIKEGWTPVEAGLKLDGEQKKKRLGLEPKVFVACDAIKRLWRRAHPMITSYWKELEDCFREAFANKGMTFQCRKVKMRSDGHWVRIALPSGRCLCYPSVAIGKRVKEPDPATDEELLRGDEISYAGFNQYTRQWGRIGTYGGKLCIAAGTPVLTEGRGWVEIENITPVDRVWDGVEWVSTGGAVCNGVKTVIDAYGAWMTPDHEVLTTGGWKHASQSARFDRAHCRLPESIAVPRQQRQAVGMGSSVPGVPIQHSANGSRHSGSGSEGRQSVLRLHAQQEHKRTQRDARHVEASGVLGLAWHGGSVPFANAPRLVWLRWARDSCMRALAKVVQNVLGRHGTDVQTGAHYRAQTQRQGLQSDELRVGNTEKTDEQHAQKRVRQESVGPYYGGATRRENRNQLHNATVPMGSRGAGGSAFGGAESSAQVFDLIDCGPRHRFVIAAGGKPLIVHNCENIVQAIACDQLAYPMLAIEEAGYPIVAHIHDEIICETPDEPEYTADKLAEMMTMSLGWNEGLPLAAAGWEGPRFHKEA